MATPRRGFILLLLSCTFWQAPLAAQASGAWSKCNQDSLSIWNCAQYYTGSVTLSSELKVGGATEKSAVTATVTTGRVICRVKPSDGPEFEGPGMIAVEHGSTENSGAYEISVWCPESAGKRPTRRESPVIVVMDQESADYTTLDGKDAHEHPDADSVNGVTGTETLTWHLVRR